MERGQGHGGSVSGFLNGRATNAVLSTETLAGLEDYNIWLKLLNKGTAT